MTNQKCQARGLRLRVRGIARKYQRRIVSLGKRIQHLGESEHTLCSPLQALGGIGALIGTFYLDYRFFLSRLHSSKFRGSTSVPHERHELRTPRMPYHAPHPFPPRDTALMAVHD